MIPNGKEIIIYGHKVVFKSEPSDCSGCFFENMDSCPDCDEGIWVEEKPSPWHTGTPTEKGWYLLKCLYPECSEYIYDTWYCTEDTELPENVVEWQKIEEASR